MLPQLLFDYLNDNFTEEMVSTFTSAGRIIDFYMGDDMDLYDPLYDIILQPDGDGYSSSMKIYSWFIYQVNSFLMESGITPNEEINLRDLCLLTETLGLLEGYEDKDAMYHILSGNDDRVFKLCLCLSLVGTRDELEYMEWISDVNDVFMDRLTDRSKPLLDVDGWIEVDLDLPSEDDLRSRKNVTDALKRLKNHPQARLSSMYELIKDGLGLYLDIDQYLPLVERYIFKYENEKDYHPDLLVWEFYILGLISRKEDMVGFLNGYLPTKLDNPKLVNNIIYKLRGIVV